MKKTISRHARIIKNAEVNCKIEGFSVSKQTKRDCLEMLRGNTSADKLVAKYKRKSIREEYDR
ncbi:MAG: hypothetical protein FH749_02470 [Firmicutes bacterium]|nr:hypothetical protein [Bacillota bacterium]